MLDNTVKNELKRIVGEANCSFSREDLICYSYDATNSPHLPDAVVFPSCAGEISLIMKMANAESFPVVPRGAGSGFSGGSLPVRGGVVISTERMKKIIEIDPDNMTAVVELGSPLGVPAEVERQGFLSSRPSSLRFCTIGGNIAEAPRPRAVSTALLATTCSASR